MLSDILPHRFRNRGPVWPGVKPRDTVAVALQAPWGRPPSPLRASTEQPLIAIDLDRNRLEQSRAFGATEVVDSGEAAWKNQVLSHTGGQRVDVAIEAVGIPSTSDMCTEIARPGGTVANVGVISNADRCDCEDAVSGMGQRPLGPPGRRSRKLGHEHCPVSISEYR